MPDQPAPRPPGAIAPTRPLRESLHEALNRQTVKIAERGLLGIDEMKRRTVRKLESKYGITDIDDLAEDLASAAKKLLIRGLSK